MFAGRWAVILLSWSYAFHAYTQDYKKSHTSTITIKHSKNILKYVKTIYYGRYTKGKNM